MEMCEEMAKLRELLTAKGIKWRDHSVIQQEKLIEYLSAESGMEKEFFDTTIYRTHFDYKGSHYSVINGFGTYGGFEPFEKKKLRFIGTHARRQQSRRLANRSGNY